jgi:hypothetical protein
LFLVSSKTLEFIIYSIGNYYLQLWTTWRQSMRTYYEGRGADCWNSVAGLVFLACAAGHRKLLFTWETIIYAHTLMEAQVVLTEQAELVEQTNTFIGEKI